MLSCSLNEHLLETVCILVPNRLHFAQRSCCLGPHISCLSSCSWCFWAHYPISSLGRQAPSLCQHLTSLGTWPSQEAQRSIREVLLLPPHQPPLRNPSAMRAKMLDPGPRMKPKHRRAPPILAGRMTKSGILLLVSFTFMGPRGLPVYSSSSPAHRGSLFLAFLLLFCPDFN